MGRYERPSLGAERDCGQRSLRETARRLDSRSYLDLEMLWRQLSWERVMHKGAPGALHLDHQVSTVPQRWASRTRGVPLEGKSNQGEKMILYHNVPHGNLALHLSLLTPSWKWQQYVIKCWGKKPGILSAQTWSKLCLCESGEHELAVSHTNIHILSLPLSTCVILDRTPSVFNHLFLYF